MSAPQISDAAAISAALAQDWNEAIRINLALLKTDKTNISLLNRLGFAYLQSGQLTLAKKNVPQSNEDRHVQPDSGKKPQEARLRQTKRPHPSAQKHGGPHVVP